MPARDQRGNAGFARRRIFLSAQGIRAELTGKGGELQKKGNGRNMGDESETSTSAIDPHSLR